jgi:septal ring factor EnvC (AmiA/AmiB activator)
MRAADGIPAVAQLKALKSEQLDVNERTDDFSRRHPNVAQLNPSQQNELRELHNDQERIQQLFQQITAKSDKQGDMP